MDTLVPVSFARVCGKTIVDPTADEEALAASNIHVVFNHKKEVSASVHPRLFPWPDHLNAPGLPPLPSTRWLRAL